LWPEESTGSTNDSSIVLLVDYGTFEALLTGDISSKVQQRLDLSPYADIIDGSIDVYKVPHHGSAGSFSEDFLDFIKPKFAVVSVGENQYGHPSPLWQQYFKAHNIGFFRTDTHKNIKITL